MLGNTYQKGDIDPLIDTNHLSKYKPGKPPSTRVLGKLDEIHKEINKSYNSDGNQWDLEIEELYTAIGWIALQEDINYPQKRGYEGRKMPFSRYLEAVQYAAEDKPVKKIIHRALSHNRQTNLDDVDYSFIN